MRPSRRLAAVSLAAAAGAAAVGAASGTPAGTVSLERVRAAMRAAPSVEIGERIGRRTVAYHVTGAAWLAEEPFADGAASVRASGREGGLDELVVVSTAPAAVSRLWVDGDGHVRREELSAAGVRAERRFSYGGSAAPAPVPVAAQDVPTGPFTAATEDGDLAVALAARPVSGGLRLTVTVLGPDGNGETALRVHLRLGSGVSAAAEASVCAAGCFRATLPTVGAPRAATVRIDRLGHAPTRVAFAFPAAWPPAPAAALVAAATRVFAQLRSVTIDERLRSDPSYTARTVWRLEAPDRLRYVTRGGPQGIVVGARRWDRPGPRQAWTESPQEPLRQPIAPWVRLPQAAARLDPGTLDGRPVDRVSWVDPAVPAWYTATFDRRTRRTLALEMVAAGHFMHHAYRDFDTPPLVAPPP